LIAENYSTHKTALIRNLFAKRSRFHFNPTYGSWINFVERWFNEIRRQNQACGMHPRRGGTIRLLLGSTLMSTRGADRRGVLNMLEQQHDFLCGVLHLAALDKRRRGLPSIQLLAQEFVQKVRLVVRINSRAEPEKAGCQVPKAVDAA
jgi:hypothetical protein